MKKYLISAVLVIALSSTALAQRHPPRPTPPHPSKTQLANNKASELDKRYRAEKKLIMNHPVATKKMKSEQLRALNARYQNEKKLLRAAR